MTANDAKRNERGALPSGLHRDTLAVREGLPAGPWGENSEALFLTSSFVFGSAAQAAACFGSAAPATSGQ